MAPRDPYRTLAQHLKNSMAASGAASKRVALYLTRGEWALVIKALYYAAAPNAMRKKAAAKARPEGDDGAT